MTPGGRRQRLSLGMLGVVGVSMLIAGFVVNPGPPGRDTTAQLLVYGASHHLTLLLGGWLQITGTVLLGGFALAVVGLSRSQTTLAGVSTLVGVVALIGVGLSEVTCYAALASGHATTVRVGADMIPAVQHGYGVVAAPLVFLALGVVVLRSGSLPAVLGMSALGFGAVFWVLGLTGMLTPIQGVVDFFSGLQALWWLAAAVLVGTRGVTPRPHGYRVGSDGASVSSSGGC